MLYETWEIIDDAIEKYEDRLARRNRTNDTNKTSEERNSYGRDMLHYYQNEIEESEIEEIKNLDLIGELRHQSKSDFFTDREVDQLELARETIIDIRWAIESQKAEYDEYQ